MDNPQAMSPNPTGQPFSEGTPVYDMNGEPVGTVSTHGVMGNALILHKGRFFPKDISIPLSAIWSSDASGIHLNLEKEELMHERYSSPPTTPGPSGGILVQGVDVIERHPATYTQGVDTIERDLHTFNEGVDTIERQPHTFTQGADTIERPAEER